MQERTRVVAIIIRDNRLLMVQWDPKYAVFWEPGWRLEEESEMDCLRREVKEEVWLDMESAEFFWTYTGPSPFKEHTTSINIVYVVDAVWDVTIGHEITNFAWISKEDFEHKKYPLLPITQNEIIPDLIKNGLLT